jgi:hypothetical protein
MLQKHVQGQDQFLKGEKKYERPPSPPSKNTDLFLYVIAMVHWRQKKHENMA